MIRKKISVRVEKDIFDAIHEIANEKSTSLQSLLHNNIIDYVNKTTIKKTENNQVRFKFIDLFAGIGGMRLGFEAVGGECVFSSEWDKYSQQTYLANHNELPNGDITQIDEKEIPNHNILIAGFPCQPFSLAGVSKKISMGRKHGFKDETQGTLFFDICRIMSEKRPNSFLLENVKNLKSHDKGKTFKIILKALEDLDYEVFYKIIDAKHYVPQHRERIFIVGFDRKRYGTNIKFEFPKSPNGNQKLSDILEVNVEEKYTLSDKLWSYLQGYAAKHKALGNGFGYGIAKEDGIARTLSARYYKDGSEILIEQHNKNPRRLTPRECARLQGFPDSFKQVVSNTQAYKQFGNSVSVPVIKHLAEELTAKLDELELLLDGESIRKCN